jgi:flagellar motor switch/type III secretory pathway protein FliN
MENSELGRFMEVPLEIEALLEGPRLSVRDVLFLKSGSIIETQLRAGENVQVLAGGSALGLGELTSSRGKVVVRMLTFRGGE